MDPRTRSLLVGFSAFALIIVVGIAALFVVFPGYISGTTNGQPSKNPVTSQYTVYVLIMGHRDRTFFHTDFHANIRVDSVTVFYQAPASPPDGSGWGGFTKSVHVTLTITGGDLKAPVITQFDINVAVGAQWGKVYFYNLDSGNYSINATGVDQDGFQSSASTSVNLP